MVSLPVNNATVLLDDKDWTKLTKAFGPSPRIEVIKAKGRPYAVIRRTVEGRRKVIVVARFLLGISDKKDRGVTFRDDNPLNLQRANLLSGSRSDVLKRKRSAKDSSSKYVGVHWSEQHARWRATIKPSPDRGNEHLGLFTSEDDAALAYNKAAKKYHGKFANLNVIPHDTQTA